MIENYRFDLYFSYWILFWLLLSIIFDFTPPFYSLILATFFHMYFINTCIHNDNYTCLHLIINVFVLYSKIIGALIAYHSKYRNGYIEFNILLLLVTLYIIYKYIINRINILDDITFNKKENLGYYNCINTPLYNIINSYSKNEN